MDNDLQEILDLLNKAVHQTPVDYDKDRDLVLVPRYQAIDIARCAIEALADFGGDPIATTEHTVRRFREYQRRGGIGIS